MEFPVPQFIEVEEKILGPLTLRQTMYLVGAAGTLFVLYFFVEVWLFGVLAVLIMGAASAFAFIKIGGRTLGKFLTSVLIYAFVPRFFIWKKSEVKNVPEKIQLTNPEEKSPEKKTESIQGPSGGLQAISRKIDLGISSKQQTET